MVQAPESGRSSAAFLSHCPCFPSSKVFPLWLSNLRHSPSPRQGRVVVQEPPSPLDKSHQEVVRSGAPVSLQIMTVRQAVFQLSDNRANRLAVYKPPC